MRWRWAGWPRIPACVSFVNGSSGCSSRAFAEAICVEVPLPISCDALDDGGAGCFDARLSWPAPPAASSMCTHLRSDDLGSRKSFAMMCFSASAALACGASRLPDVDEDRQASISAFRGELSHPPVPLLRFLGRPLSRHLRSGFCQLQLSASGPKRIPR